MRTYYVLANSSGDKDEWRYLGPVEASSADAARTTALSAHSIPGATAVAVPERSWKPEWFGLERVEPRYVKGDRAPAGQEQLA